MSEIEKKPRPRKPKPSRWPAYTSSAHRKGQKPSLATGQFFYTMTRSCPPQ